MTAKKTPTDAEILDPEATALRVQLVSGLDVEIGRMKTRQFFRMLRILTKGAPEMVGMITTWDTEDSEQFAYNIAGLLIYAIPEAEDAAINFVKSMVVYPANVAQAAQLDIEMDNPELEDLLSIVHAVLQTEADDLRALGKRLQSLFKVAEKTGAMDPTSPAAKASDI